MWVRRYMHRPTRVWPAFMLRTFCGVPPDQEELDELALHPLHPGDPPHTASHGTVSFHVSPHLRASLHTPLRM